MKKSSEKKFLNFADENNQKQNDLLKKEHFIQVYIEENLIGCNEQESYIEVSKQWAVKKFQSLQQFKGKRGKCIFGFFHFVYLT